MGPKSKNIAVFGNKSTYLTFDEFLQLPLPEFDPFKEGQRLFIIRKPNFMRRLEQNIVERFRISSCDGRYRLAKVDPHDVPKVHYNKVSGTWMSNNGRDSVWTWVDSSQRKRPTKPTPLSGICMVEECMVASEEYKTAVLEYIGDTINRDMDETYQRIVERQFNNLLE